ncbi:hypothetical protein FL622_06095 [Desulfuromonas acetexigens]|uniref:Uncharacterized protein n=1 Tax=Trichloromonas acetexigens TaxID=38815 RepID=A0A550JHQ1_9BACT|nr:hypothetical protein FL622_06095 [Desulfuromonas acetexigens]
MERSRIRFISSRFKGFKKSSQHSLLPTPYSLLPTPYSLLPTPYSLLPTPYSLLPTPYSSPILVASSMSITGMSSRIG